MRPSVIVISDWLANCQTGQWTPFEAAMALKRALAKEGYTIVPTEPTDAMLSAGDSMMPQIAAGEDITTGYDALKEAWPAMMNAAALSSTQSGGATK